MASYWVREGVEVRIQPVSDAAELDVRSYLLGSIFAALCHQRELLPLHGSAVATAAGAFAFLGASGAGKSSLAAFLAGHGFPLVSDDIFLIDPGAPLDRRVIPVAPWLKLWTTTLDALGATQDGLSRVFTDDEKFRYTGTPTSSAPLPLAGIVLLERAEGNLPPDSQVLIETLSPAEALRAMLDHTYQAWLVRALGLTERYFVRCGSVLDGARALRLRRPWGFSAMGEVVEALKATLLQTGGD